MEQTNISVLTLTVAASAALAAGRFVTEAGAYPAAGGSALGVTRTSAGQAGDLVPVDTLGTTMVEAGADLSAGQGLQVDATGRVVPHTTGVMVGRALGAASSAGDFVEVLLIPNA